MILIDHHHLCMRLLFSSIQQCKPKKIQGKYNTADYASFMVHGIISSIGYFIKEFKEYGEIVVCLEGSSWRKKEYLDYKANRKDEKEKSDVNFEEVFKIFDEIVEALSTKFGIKTIRTPNAEGDDVIAILAKLCSQNKQKTIVVSSDKDFNQLYRYSYIELYDPIKKEFRKKPKDIMEIESELKNHIIRGDAVDNIPSVLSETVFCDEFKKFLKENDVYCDTPNEFFKLSVSKELIEKYDVFDTYKSGKNKGKKKDNKLIFKTTPLTQKRLDEIKGLDIEDKNCIYHDAFVRNRKLIDFNYIPENVEKEILEAFKNIETPVLDTNAMMDFCAKWSLKQIMTNISIFLVHKKDQEKSPDMEW